MKKLLAVSATALLVSLPLAIPAWAMPTGAGVGEGRNISVFHNLDFVATFGHPVGAPIAVDVFRDGVQIGHAFGNTVSAPEGLPLDGALEVNHGPEGPAVQGDCWEGFTPDIIPRDRIVVSDNTDPTNPVVLDEVLVDDITISGEPKEDLSTADPTDIILEGRAAFADGTPIPIERLDSGELRLGSRFRANPNIIERIPGTTDGWRATYKAPYAAFKGEDLPLAQQKQAILDGDHAMGYGHVAPLPPETQLVEGLGGGGPALGCESAPKQSNAVTTSDDAIINLASGSLNLSGTAMEAVSAVRVTLSDTDPITPDVPVDATALSAGPGEKTWSASFTREEVESQADGTLTASGAYTLPGGTVGGATKEIDKDTAITVGDVNLADASDTGNGDVGSGSDDLTSDATPTLNGTAEAGSTVEVFDGATPLGQTTAGSGGDWELTVAPDEALGNGAHPLKASATDAAGNAAESANALTVTVDTTAPAVNASPQGGLYRTPRNVNLKLANAAQETGTRIYFTLDGSVPQPIAEQLYSGPINVPNTQTQRLKYRALDRAGNISATGTQVYRFDTVAPRITNRSPAANATGVPLGSNVRATFSEAVTGVGSATFRLRQGATSVPAVVTYNAATRTAMLNPDANLVSGRRYTVVLTSGIRDSVGNRLAPTSWTFTAR